MNQQIIIELIETAKKIDFNSINTSNDKINGDLKLIFEFVRELDTIYIHVLEGVFKSKIRFCDYYDSDLCNADEIIDYFDKSYDGKDKDELTEFFAMYVFLRNVVDLLVALEMFDDYEEMYEFLDNGSYFDDLLYMLDYIKEREMSFDDEVSLKFLDPNNKYKIFFSGLAHDDIVKLPKQFKKALIKKLSGQLSNSDYVTLAESVDHVKEAYGFPLFRVQFGNDYRIAYIRRDGVTAILGVTLKTGKDLDYTRYDSIARNKDDFYNEVHNFLNNNLCADSEHYLTISHLESFMKKK
ncbi:MAG: hypothetical protein IJ475_01030 [Bacilli bacterium]|nr:hypothetical protein [Bacilli bacterium]